MNSLHDPLVERYLQEVANALRAADPERRNEILEQIADHIVADASELAPGDDEGLRLILERLGPPADIAAAADLAPYGMPMPDAPPSMTVAPPPEPTGTAEKWALAAFLVSPVLCLLGWLVGVALLWSSRIWTTRHKVIGTIATLPFALMIVLGGMGFLTAARTSTSVSAAPSTIVFAPPTATGGVSVPSMDDVQVPESDELVVTESTETSGWTIWRVLAISGWALVVVIVPIGTIVWLWRAVQDFPITTG